LQFEKRHDTFKPEFRNSCPKSWSDATEKCTEIQLSEKKEFRQKHLIFEIDREF
jgi:hypothetical protein